MRVLASRTGDTLRLSWAGCDAIDSANAQDAKREALKALSDAPNVIVDLSGVMFLDSAGVGVLVGLFKHARGRGARVRFCGLAPTVRSVLELIQLDRIFEIYDDAEAAAR